ncbi:MAG: glycoside hydrolase family 36 protein [Promethearchaeota archaeon]
MIETINDNEETFEAFNGIIGIKFYKKGENKGKYEIILTNKKLVECQIKDCYTSINFYSQKQETLIEVTSNTYNFKSNIENIKDLLGNGLKITFEPINNEIHDILFKIQFKIYKNKDFILVKLIDILDKSQNQLSVHSISPLTMKNGLLWLFGGSKPTNLHNITWFKNGWQSWSSCGLFFGKEKDTQGSSTEILKMIYDNQDYKIEGRFYSEYCTVITDSNSKNSLVLGFVSLKDQFSRIILDYDGMNEIRLLIAFGCMDNISFNKSNINSSEELFICFKKNNNGYYGLIDYAKVVNKNLKETIIQKIPIGWCSWYYYFTNISQDEMVKNLEFFQHHTDMPIDFIQLDDGYFTKIGDFANLNEKFPDGLPWLFEYIKKLGFKGGIWTAPFIAIKRSQFFREHRDWFLTKNNNLLPVLFNWNSFEYTIDLSNEEVLDFLKLFFSNLLNAFKKGKADNNNPLINFFKIDFLHAATPYSADYTNPKFTRAQLLYNAVKIIRDAISDNSFLLGCGAPLGPCVGLVNAMRISCDTAPLWNSDFIEKFENGRGIADISLKAALLNTLYRSFMHRYFWINDPDCLMIRRSDTKLNIDEIRLQMTIFGLSGGQILISDDMTKLSRDEINDAKLLIPPYNPKDNDPIVIDAFISELPTIYMLETKEIIGKRYLVAIINWDDSIAFKELKILDLIPNLLKNERIFYLYDFWNNKFLGEINYDDIFTIRGINPHSCSYLTIIPVNERKINSPILISSNLHITQGCCEIKQFEYNFELKQLKIKIELKGKREGTIIVKLPKGMKIIKTDYKYYQIEPKENLWNINVQFTNYLSFNIDLD